MCAGRLALTKGPQCPPIPSTPTLRGTMLRQSWQRLWKRWRHPSLRRCATAVDHTVPAFGGLSWSTNLDWIGEAGNLGYACCAESHPSIHTLAVPLAQSSHTIPRLCVQTGCEACKTCGSLSASTCDPSPPHAAAVMVACARHAPHSPACCRLPVTPTSPPLPSRPATSGPRRLLRGSGSAGKGRLIPQQQQQQQRCHCR